MKRYPVVIGATAAGLAGILSFHTRNSSQPLSHNLAVTATGSGHRSSTTGSSTPPSASGRSKPSTAAPTTSSVTGASEQYGYGVLSVRVTISGPRITDVEVATLQTAESYSQQIAEQAIPYLRQQVLDAQSANIDGISGATYTSEAYAYSVQAALDQLHFQ